STVGEPAYFHGGQAEEAFRTQLDQTLADHMTEATADQIADPMFRNQFPQLAATLENQPQPLTVDDLGALRRL
ncbi:MAG: rod-binding protein, partial [Planctomycetales bacterium]|nr:rod-binding protein [Planctomycetales bacterium]